MFVIQALSLLCLSVLLTQNGVNCSQSSTSSTKSHQENLPESSTGMQRGMQGPPMHGPPGPPGPMGPPMGPPMHGMHGPPGPYGRYGPPSGPPMRGQYGEQQGRESSREDQGSMEDSQRRPHYPPYGPMPPPHFRPYGPPMMPPHMMPPRMPYYPPPGMPPHGGMPHQDMHQGSQSSHSNTNHQADVPHNHGSETSTDKTTNHRQ